MDTREAVQAFNSPTIVSRWKRDKYGEVNAALMMVLPYIPADKKAVILRCPRASVLSTVNFYAAKGKSWDSALTNVEFWYRCVDFLAQSYRSIRYSDLFSGKSAIRDFATWLGIQDLGPIDLSIRHNTTSKKYKTWADLPAPWRRQWEQETDWFKAKWDL